jgi:hypothetical protein
MIRSMNPADMPLSLLERELAWHAADTGQKSHGARAKLNADSN